MTIEHYGELIKSWMTQRGLSEKDLAAKLGITETGVRNRLKESKIKPDTLANYAKALGVEIRETREFVLLPAETENALLDEVLSRPTWQEEQANVESFYANCPIPRAPTPEEIEAARKDWEAEQRTGIAEAIAENETE